MRLRFRPDAGAALPGRISFRPVLVVFLLGLAAAATVLAQGMQPGGGTGLPLRMEVVPGSAARLSDDHAGIVLDGAGEARVRLHVELPPPDGGSPWVLWLGRDSLDSVRLQSGDWHALSQGFFTPSTAEGLMPGDFTFALPSTWSGPRTLELVARADGARMLRPQLLRQAQATAREYRVIALASTLYACLAVLALIGLSLFVATRDRAFLALFGFLAAALAFLLAINGHLYALPGLRHFALWGVSGVWALTLLTGVAGVWAAQHYAALALNAPRLQRILSGVGVVLLLLAALCLLDLPGIHAWLQPATTAGWGLAVVAATAACLVATRRHLSMGVPVLLMLLLLGLAGGAYEAMLRGFGPGGFWIRHGYQMALVACAVVLAIGLIGRITEFRTARDRDRLARDDSERRLVREGARAELVQTLQRKLRELPPGDMEWAAFRTLFERLLPLLQLEAGALIAYGYHGFDLLLAEPLRSKDHFTALLANRVGMMKGLARTQAPLQLPLEEEANGGDGNRADAPATDPGNPNPRVSGTRPVMRRLHAVVPLPIRAPGWGVLLLERADDRGFSHDELALASEFARLAVQHADEAATALNLRRSAELDSLTGTLNRRTIDLWLARSFSDAHRDQQPLAVLFVDLDHFKNINDTYGHPCGDVCLRKVSETLRRELQPGDLLGRYGGEEFLVLLPGRSGDAARQIGEQIRAAVEREDIDCNGRIVKMTVSVGVATRLDREDAPNPTVERADKALYAAKRAGRNRVNVAPAVFN